MLTLNISWEQTLRYSLKHPDSNYWCDRECFHSNKNAMAMLFLLFTFLKYFCCKQLNFFFIITAFSCWFASVSFGVKLDGTSLGQVKEFRLVSLSWLSFCCWLVGWLLFATIVPPRKVCRFFRRPARRSKISHSSSFCCQTARCIFRPTRNNTGAWSLASCAI